MKFVRSELETVAKFLNSLKSEIGILPATRKHVFLQSGTKTKTPLWINKGGKIKKISTHEYTQNGTLAILHFVSI